MSCNCATKIKELKEEIETRKESERRAWSEVACLNNERASYCVRAEKAEPKFKKATKLLERWVSRDLLTGTDPLLDETQLFLEEG